MKRRRDSEGPDLFARMGADGGGTPSLPNAVRGRVAGPSATADVPDGGGTPSLPISSPLVEETKEWLSARALTLGNMLASERAAEYVSILRALAEFRAEIGRASCRERV